jgi:hypothetical protein
MPRKKHVWLSDTRTDLKPDTNMSSFHFSVIQLSFAFSGFDSGSEELHRKLADSQKMIEKQSLEIKDLQNKLSQKPSVSSFTPFGNNKKCLILNRLVYSDHLK